MHRLSAGAGYQYLLKHTDSGDPPGRWLGTGPAGVDNGAGLAIGTTATETAMANLFGAGKGPVTAAPLGRPHPATVPTAHRVAAKTTTLPADMTPEARQAAIDTNTRVELAKKTPTTVAGLDLTFTHRSPSPRSGPWLTTPRSTRCPRRIPRRWRTPWSVRCRKPGAEEPSLESSR